MKKLILFLNALMFLTFINFEGCKKSESPSENQPITSNQTGAFRVLIQSPSSEDYFITTTDTVSISGTIIGSSDIKQVIWTMGNGSSGTASGLTSWKINSLPLSPGDNTIAVIAIDNNNSRGSDTITVIRNKALLFKTLPQFSPSTVMQNISTNVRITIGIIPNANLIDSTVKLVRVDSKNQVTSTLTQLYDDGNLSHGDDIKGDRVYSALINFNEAKTGMARLRVTAQTQQSPSPVTDYSGVGLLKVYASVQEDKFTEVTATQEEAVKVLNQNMGNKNIDEAITKTTEWLKTQPQVQSAEKNGYCIKIVYKSGLLGGLLIDEVDDNGFQKYKGGIRTGDTLRSLKAPQRSQSLTIPISRQSTGSYSKLNKILKGDTTLILNKKVLLYAPFDAAFSTSFATNAQNKIKESKLGLKTSYFANQYASVVVLQNMTDYGLIIIDSHGSSGDQIATGEIVSPQKNQQYQSLLAPPNPQLGQFTDVIIKSTLLIFQTKETVYTVNSDFVKALLGQFPNSIIFNGSCESTQQPFLEVEFKNKGAKTYLGFSQNVGVTFCSEVGTDFVKKLVVDEKTTGESFTGKAEPGTFCWYQLKGSDKMHYTSGLINGDFEYGDVVSWDVLGDGRVINQLGSLTPPGGDYMGIISTGLGFAINRGIMSQSFRIKQDQSTLSLKWNFLSEEFLEYIGSSYQDFFSINLVRENGEKIELLKFTIDDIAGKFGASKESPGSLIKVSPGIVFDKGDVFMTGWQDFSANVSAYRGETLTLELNAGDVGDSSYDTAILIDNIEVK